MSPKRSRPSGQTGAADEASNYDNDTCPTCGGCVPLNGCGCHDFVGATTLRLGVEPVGLDEWTLRYGHPFILTCMASEHLAELGQALGLEDNA